MKKILISLIRFVRKSRIFPVSRKLADFYLRVYDGDDCPTDPECNGEYWLLDKVLKKSLGKGVVLDVGANVGDWTKKCLEINDLIEVYSFELAAPTFRKLKKNIGQDPRVKCFDFGLSDLNTKAELAYIPESDTGSSIDILPWGLNIEKLSAVLKKGDDFLEGNNLDDILLMKIDTEGHECKVIKGFEEALKGQKIKSIQFEYGYTYIPGRNFLKDIYDLLHSSGYSVGRIYPEGVNFKNYNIFKDENFKMCNYFATCDSSVRSLVATSLTR